jgi:hypothetical protein
MDFSYANLKPAYNYNDDDKNNKFVNLHYSFKTHTENILNNIMRSFFSRATSPLC